MNNYYFNNAMIVISVIVVLFITCLTTRAAIVEVDGLYYSLGNYAGQNMATLCLPPNGEYDVANVVIPESIKYQGDIFDVTAIATDAFKDCKKIKTIQIGRGISQIWGVAFWNSSVENIAFPDNDELRVAYGVFQNCNNLDSLVFDSEVTTLVTGWYVPTGIRKIIFNKKAELTSIPTAGVKQTNPPKHNTVAKENKEEASMPEIVWSKISNIAFVHSLSYYDVDHLRLSNKVVLQGNGYGGVGLEELATLELEATDTETMAQLIDDAYGVNRYPLDRDYSQIGMTALVDCKKLTTIISRSETPWTIAPNAFASDEAMKAITIYVPETALDTYKAHPVWGKMGAILPIDDGVNDITTDENGGAVEYFDMQGRRIDNPRPGTLVIRRQGASATKVVVK